MPPHRYPLTRQQEVLWVEWKLDPTNVSYNMCVQQRLEGPLVVPRFQRAVQDTINYFEALRFYYTEENGVPYQAVKPRSDWKIPYIDVSEGGELETEASRGRALAQVSEQLREPIQLTDYPIFRGCVVQSASQVFYFLGMVPHIVSDAYSALLMLESISIAYNRGSSGLDETYRGKCKTLYDYFQHLDQKPPRVPLEQSLQHWHTVLKDANFLVDFGRNSGPTFYLHEGRRHYFSLPETASANLKAIASSERSTIFFAIGACLNALLHLYFQTRDTLTGYPVNIRPPGFKHCFGFFVNIIPLRTRMSPETTFRQLMQQMTAQRKQDKRHQFVHGLDIVRMLREKGVQFPGRVFNVALSQTLVKQQKFDIEGVDSQALAIDYTQVNEDLMLYYETTPDRLNFMLDYKTALFEPGFIQGFVDHFKRLARTVGDNPDIALADISLLTARDHGVVLDQFQPPTTPYDQAATLVSMFRRCALEDPQNTALIAREELLTYEQLDRRSSQVAHILIEKGVKRGDFVGVAMKRSPDLLVTLYAVLKTGAAYVPLDPGYPPSRLAYMLKDCGAAIIITHDDLAAALPSTSAEIVHLDRYRTRLAAAEKTAFCNHCEPEDIAYLMYTSGSTGKPKGVLVSHHNIAMRIQGLQQLFPLTTQDCSLQNTVYSFDVSVTELFWPLSVGIASVLTPFNEHKNPRSIIRLIDAHRVTVASFVPSMINALALQIKPGECASLKTVISIGESLAHQHKIRFHQGFRDTTLYNFYGPTETTVYATFVQTSANDKPAINSIGRCLPNTTAYVMNDRLNPVPPGIVGELVLGGPGVAAGYWNRPHLTAERFVPDPYGGHGAAKLYRTGDLARFLPDGQIEFLGRMDTQVKIRGFRVELGEIESVLMAMETIQSATVAAIDNEKGRQLAAYLIFKNRPVPIPTVKEHLARHVPDYMVPLYYTPMESFPMTRSGKIDRKALPPPKLDASAKRVYIAPRSDIERNLVRLWADKLKLPAEQIGVDDDFFELGGDSLLMIQLSTAMEKYGYLVEPHDLFIRPTIAQIAKIVSPASPPTAEPRPRVCGQYALLPRHSQFFADPIEVRNHWNRCYLFQIQGIVPPAHFKRCTDLLLEVHDGLRTCFVCADGRTVQSVSAADPQAYFSHVDLRAETDPQEHIVHWVNTDHRQLDLARPPLFKIRIFRTDDTRTTIAIVIHHLLVDISSTRILLEDLLTLLSAPDPVAARLRLGAQSTTVKAWSQNIQGFLSDHSTLLDEEIGFWKRIAERPAPVLPLDGGTDPRANIEAHKTTRTFGLQKEPTHDLFNRVTPETPIQTLLLTALSQALYDWTGQSRVLFNTCGHGRHGQSPLFEKIDLKRTVGWINTVYPVQIQLPVPDDALPTVAATLQKIPYQGAHFGILRYQYKPGREQLQKLAYPEIFFNYVSRVDAMLPESTTFQPLPVPKTIQSAAPQNDLIYKLYMEAGIYQDRLTIQLSYSHRLFETATIQRFINCFTHRLEILSQASSGMEPIS